MVNRESADAERFVSLTADICTFLDRLGFVPPPAGARAIKVAYHDACHLAHAQRVRAAPRQILRSIPGLELIEPAEWELCCGSAGSYNLEQPETAAKLGRRKALNLLDTGAEMIATGNIGCTTQIEAHLHLLGRPMPVLHTVEILRPGLPGAAVASSQAGNGSPGRNQDSNRGAGRDLLLGFQMN